MLVIQLNVAVTNAIIFFLLDVPAAWAIQRGLLALQSYYLYRQARAGRTVPLARSRIPIVGGELLRGVTDWPSIFVLVNIAVLVCLCFATLGVDAGKELRWERASFKNITTLAMPSSHELSTSIFPDTKGGRSFVDKSGRRINVTGELSFRDTKHEDRICRTRNATHAEYWPVVFNAKQIGPKYASNFWFADNASCQANATGATPILTTSCVSIDSVNPCSLDAMSCVKTVHLQFDNASNGRVNVLARNATSSEWYTTLTRVGWDGNFRPLVGSRVYVFKYRYDSMSPSYSLLLINHSSTRSWFFSLGFNNGRISSSDPNAWNYSITTPLRLSPHGSASADYILLGLRTNLNIAAYMKGIHFSSDQYTRHSSFMPFEDILQRIYRGVPLPPTRAAYIRKPDEDVTTVDLRATILYGLIIVLAIVLLPMKEVLDFVLVRYGKLKNADLFAYDYDQLSKEKRELLDRLNGVPLSGKFSSMQL